MINPVDLCGRVVMVTGASSGIGRETSHRLSQLGARVIMLGRHEKRLEETLASMEGAGHHAVSCDLSMVEAIPNLMRDLAAEFGPLTGLVHCAAINGTQPLRTWDAAFHDVLMRINVTAALALAKGFRHSKVRAPGASIVLMSSASGLIGTPAIVDYSASKGAIIGMTRTLAVELAREDIRVNCIAAGMVRSGMGARLENYTAEQIARIEGAYPLGLGTGLDIANSIVFLLSPMSRWITGSVLVVDGGCSIS